MCSLLALSEDEDLLERLAWIRDGEAGQAHYCRIQSQGIKALVKEKVFTAYL